MCKQLHPSLTIDDVIEFLQRTIEFNENYLNDMPAGCHNSYGAGEAIGCKNTAKEILHLIETGEYPDD